ncbi:MAG: ferrous iron transport protein B [Lachnospiraceae bacterium]|nr:ferrous iron transport protein B [Lachnospiraceae bacterium]MDY5742617.1 ferrous iron transport protein B [Lachnospiraceae bacterium]
MAIRIALVGNPNSGKTTMFNALTGSTQYVGNWPGVTVEKKEGRLKKHKEVIVTDLPGIYSLSPYTLEEVVSRDYLVNERPEVIVNVVDASNIERNLYLTTQLVEIGIPVVVALNMMDIIAKRGDILDIDGLARDLGCTVVTTSALKRTGIDTLIEAALKAGGQKAEAFEAYKFGAEIETVLDEIKTAVPSICDGLKERWYAIKLFEKDEKVLESYPFEGDEKEKVLHIVDRIESEMDDDAESIITNERYAFIGKLVKKHVKKSAVGLSLSDRVDKIVTNRLLALPIFALVMWAVYYVAVTVVGGPVTDWVNGTLVDELVKGNASAWLESAGVAEWMISLIADGIIAGVGAVVGFVPLIATIFLLLGILEDIGYMARIAFIMDRIFRRFGLSGKSFIPFMIGTGCSVPAIASTRTIENDNDRRITIMVNSFVPCGAKLPIISMIAAAIFRDSVWVGPATYLGAVAAIIVAAIILKKTRLFSGDTTPFIMELPEYHFPNARNVLLHVWDKVKSFIVKAGTIILLSSVALWFLQNINTSFQFRAFDDASSQSLLAAIGSFVAPVLKPLGFGNWQAAVSSVVGLVAKENLVTSFAVITGFVVEEADAVGEATDFLGYLRGVFTPASAISFLAFNMLNTPCFAAVGSIRREMNNAKYTLTAIGFQLIYSYTIALMLYQFIGLALGEISFGAGTVAAIIVLLVYLFLLFRRAPKKEQK